MVPSAMDDSSHVHMVTGPISQGVRGQHSCSPCTLLTVPEEAHPFQAPSLPTDWGAARTLDVATPCPGVTDFSSLGAHQKALGGGSGMNSLCFGVMGKEGQAVLASLTEDRGP